MLSGPNMGGWEKRRKKRGSKVPFRIAAFPDLMAREDMLAITSGRASNIMRSTPMGQVTRVSSRPSSSRVRRVILFTIDI